MVKYVHAVDGLAVYELFHTSFQSTLSCNIATVNALNEYILWLQKRNVEQERARGFGGLK